MNKMTAAILFAIALPAAAHAQASYAPKSQQDLCPCCKGEKMMARCENMRCGDHAGHRKPDIDPHAGHDMSQHGGGHHPGQPQPQR